MRFPLLCSALGLGAAHVCLLYPSQRGGWNVTDAGDNSCFQPTAPCGKAAAETPAITLAGGQGFNVLLQQNLNHYNVGHSGFLDIAWAPFPATDDANFTVIGPTVPDYWAHLQAKQTNFSVTVMVPNITCAHCVLRVRYVANKPTEPLAFHNCADVAIVPSASTAAAGRRYLALMTAGHPASVTSSSSVLVEIEPSGLLQPLADLGADGITIVDGMSTAVGRVYYAMGIPREGSGGMAGNAAPWTLVSHDTATGRTTYRNITLPAGDTDAPAQWTALTSIPAYAGVVGKLPLALLGLARSADTPGSWVFQARLLDPATAMATKVLAVSPPQDTYVNFFGVTAAAADAASTKGTFYFLSGDENSLTTLGAQVGEVVFDTAAPTPSTMTLVSQDTKAFTLSNLHMSPADGSLYGVSPGLYGQTGWSLVKETFATGAVAPVGSTVAGSALFASWYGGGLSGYVFTSDGGLAHVFRHALDGSLSLCTIDVTTGLMRTAPTLLTGVNGATSVTGVTAVMAA